MTTPNSCAEAARALQNAGLSFTIVIRSMGKGRSSVRFIFQAKGGSSVEFYPSTGRWRLVGGGEHVSRDEIGKVNDCARGGVGRFIKWYRTYQAKR